MWRGRSDVDPRHPLPQARGAAPGAYVARTVRRRTPCLHPPRPVIGDHVLRGGSGAAAATTRLLGCGLPSQQTAGRTPVLAVCTTTIAGNVPAGILRPRPAQRGIQTLHVHMAAVPPPRLARIGGVARPARHEIRSRDRRPVPTCGACAHSGPLPPTPRPAPPMKPPWERRASGCPMSYDRGPVRGDPLNHFSQGLLGVRQVGLRSVAAPPIPSPPSPAS